MVMVKGEKGRPWGQPLWRMRRITGAIRREQGAIDVAIVGGGLTGMSAALHLARDGVHAAVFEAATVGEGASGRTGGIVLEGTATGTRPDADDCVPSLARLVSEVGIDCDLHLPGCWEIEHGESDGGVTLPWHDEGHPIRIARTVAGGTVEPRALLFGLADAAMAAGATVEEHQPVRRIGTQGPVVELDDRRVHPSHVVVAVNAWTTALIADLPQVHSALTYACATEPLDREVLSEIGLGERVPFYTADLPYLWSRVAPNGEVVFGAGLKFGAAHRLEDIEVGDDESQAILSRLENRVRMLNPALARVNFVARWAGPISFTDDTIPLLGEHPQNPAIIVAGAYAGHGVAFGVHAGALIARTILEKRPLPRWGALANRSRSRDS
jgi:gamma-glutamylputrescine oxidase